VVSVDAKKKKWVAIIRTEALNGPPKGSPDKLPVPDFPDPKKGQTTP
jgi:hypothetical protein